MATGVSSPVFATE